MIMLDKYGRHHHDQLFRNNNLLYPRLYVDTIELAFDRDLSPPERDHLSALITRFAGKPPTLIARSHPGLLTIGLPADNYEMKELEEILIKADLKPTAIKACYSARLQS